MVEKSESIDRIINESKSLLLRSVKSKQAREIARLIFEKMKEEILESCDEEYRATKENEKAKKALIRRATRSYGTPCDICSEKRIINLCHVLPRSQGGTIDQSNIIHLCPTHHFLFDHARLSKSEFDAIKKSHLSEQALGYLNNVHARRHHMHWNYQTYRFAGCSCGSQDLEFSILNSGYSVQICLKCLRCDEKWLNLWEETHPITKLRFFVGDMPVSDAHQQLRLAEKRANNFLRDDLQRVLNGLEW